MDDFWPADDPFGRDPDDPDDRQPDPDDDGPWHDSAEYRHVHRLPLEAVTELADMLSQPPPDDVVMLASIVQAMRSGDDDAAVRIVLGLLYGMDADHDGMAEQVRALAGLIALDDTAEPEHGPFAVLRCFLTAARVLAAIGDTEHLDPEAYGRYMQYTGCRS